MPIRVIPPNPQAEPALGPVSLAEFLAAESAPPTPKVTPELAPGAVAELGGRVDGLDPTRYGDWEKNGRCIDF